MYHAKLINSKYYQTSYVYHPKERPTIASCLLTSCNNTQVTNAKLLCFIPRVSPLMCVIVYQEKAKLWSDTNTVKMVFVSNSESVDRRMQKCPSCWSRAAAPIHIGDLSDADATSFLQRAKHLESIAGDADLTSCMADSYARETVRLVGGRIHQLIAVKGAWLTGSTFEGTACELRQKEREKFLDVFRRPAVWKVVDALRTAPGKRVLLSRLIERTNTEDVELLLTNDIIRCVRNTCGLVVTFESKLTEHIVDEFYQR